MITILKILSLNQNGCTPEHIALHTNILEPFSILDELKKKGYVCNIESNGISPIQGTRFGLTPKGQRKLEELKAQITRIPLDRLALSFQMCTPKNQGGI